MTYEQIIQKAGKRIVPRVYYYVNGVETSLNRDDFQQAKFKFNASLVGSVMFGVELEVKKVLPDTEIFIEITAKYDSYTQKKVYGGYLRRSEPTYNADAKTYTYEMYDKIITAMVDYKPIDINYPTTVYDFFKKLVSSLNFTTDITSLPNGTKTIEKDIYDGINYTYRDVLNDIGQATGTLFVIDDNEIKKCELGTSTKTIDDDILKNQNITLGKHFGPINTIVLTRSGESDSIYYPKVLPTNPIEFRIADNQLMNENDREDYLEAIYNQLNGIEFDVYDTALVGYGGFTPLEKIKISTGEKEYNSYVFNNEITISQGYEEVIYTEMPTETSTDYKAGDSTDRRINQVYIIARKLEKEIVAVIDVTNKMQKEINPIEDKSGSEITIEDASNNPLTYLEIEGKSTQKTRSGRNFFNFKDAEGVPSQITTDDDGWITATYDNTEGTATKYLNYFTSNLDLEVSKDYKIFLEVKNISGGGSISATNSHTNSQFKVGYTVDFTALSNNSIYSSIVTTKDDFSSSLYGLRTFVGFGVGKSGSITFRISLIEDTSITTDTFEYEAYGVSPSPDFPSEIESVGYENLLETNLTSQTINGVNITVNQDKSVTLNGTATGSFDIIWKNDTFTMLKGTYSIGLITVTSNFNLYLRSSSGNTILMQPATKTFATLNLENDTTYTSLRSWVTSGTSFDNVTFYPMILKGTKKHNYIPYGKYGIEVEITNENSYDENGIISNYYLDSTGNEVSSSAWRISNYIRVEPNKVYKYSGLNTIGNAPHSVYYDENKNILSTFKQATGENKITIPVNAYYVRFSIHRDDINFTINRFNTLLILLNKPLRSLPNGVKDIAYLKNDKLYVDRYVGSIVLDGSSVLVSTNYSNLYFYRINDYNTQYGFSNYFRNIVNSSITANSVANSNLKIGEFTFRDGDTKDRIYFQTNFTSLEDFKNWLSEHPTQVDYELAEPYTEELGEVEMLKTLKGYNNILTTDELLPIINLTYVRDTILADYVENHVAELKLTEKEIKTSVETVSSSVDGLNTSINRVEEITTDNSQIINVISKNIITEGDKAGTVTEVTTTTGFTFNKDGMTIDDGSGFRAEHTAKGTYYKDGTSIVGQYTKDGSKQKDLELFGTYSYGKKDIDATPMFVGQLYNDENGEECFGHFYNGGDY